MKKILIFALVALMLAVNVFAADVPEIEAELKSRAAEAIDFLVDFYIEGSVDFFDSKKINILDYVPSTEYKYQYCIEDYSLYLKRTDAYADWNEFEKKASYFFTDSVADNFIKYSGAYNLNGKTYCTAVLGMAQSCKYLFYCKGEVEVSYDESFKIVSINDTEAIVEFELYNDFSRDPVEKHGFTFVNTNGEWKISAGTLLDLYFVEGMLNAPSFAPQTGVDAVAYAAVAVVALAAVAVVVKKRRIV